MRTSSRQKNPTRKRLEYTEDSDSEMEVEESEEEDEDDQACFQCGYTDPPGHSEADSVDWYQCDNSICERWYHAVCLSDTSKPEDGETWNCPICALNAEL